MARPAKPEGEKWQSLSITFPPELLERLRRTSETRMVAAAALIRLGLEVVLETLDADTRPAGLRLGIPTADELRPGVLPKLARREHERGSSAAAAPSVEEAREGRGPRVRIVGVGRKG